MMHRKKLALIIIVILFSASNVSAQGEIQIGTGVALPITGYRQVLKNGWLLSAEGRSRFGKGNFAMGMKAHFTRLQKDKTVEDAFHNSRMTIGSLLFTNEYEGNINQKLRPFFSLGLGISLFNLNYDSNTDQHTALTNVSFTMAPQLGLRYAASKQTFVFVESSLVLIADGPPPGFPKSDRMTGYNAIVAGVGYSLR
jgi:hypothetical protein